MNRKTRLSLFLIAGLGLLLFAGDHPLVEHWGDTASSGAGTFGSQWIHTDTSGVRYGLWGESASSDARGVFGSATSTDGSGLAIGVYGETDSPTGRGVHGYASNSSGVSYGVTGSTQSADAVAAGVFGFNNRTTGSTRGIQGIVLSSEGFGVFGSNNSTGSNAHGAGVIGINTAPVGNGYGIYGYNSSVDGWSGNFLSVGNGVSINSATGKVGLVVAGGSKSASVPTSDGDRLLYNEESTEVWFSDYGSARLENGFAFVSIDRVFAETVNLEELYHIFLQPYGDASLYVGKVNDSSFEVWASSGSVNKNITFSYRIVARRLGFEEQRLEFAPWVTAEQPYLILPPPPENLYSINEVGEGN